MPEMGTLTFQQSGSTAMSAVDDVMPTAYDASWDVLGATAAASNTAGQALKKVLLVVLQLTIISFTLHQKWLKV